MGRLSVLDRGLLAKFFKDGASNSTIRRQLGISTPTVTKWRTRWDGGDKTLKDLPRMGRPRKHFNSDLTISK